MHLTRHARVHASPLARGSVAFFDLDRTLVPGSSLVVLARALVGHHVVSRRSLAKGLTANAVFARRGAGDSTASRLRERSLETMAGVERAPLLEVLEGAGAAVADRMYPGARWLVERHRDAGDFCVLVSAAPQELVDAVVRAAGLHRGVGTRGEVVDGCFTGRLDGAFCYGEGKVERLTTELGSFDRATASAYADSPSDIPLLRATARPVAVNPDRRMTRVARDEGWPILRFS